MRYRTAAFLWWLTRKLASLALRLEKPKGANWTCFIHGWLARKDLDGEMSIPLRHFIWADK